MSLLQVTWCYSVEGNQQYCATGFPMGCYVDKSGNPQDACVISKDYNKADTYYIFNHVDITISYHSGLKEDWGKFLLDSGEQGGRIVGETMLLPSFFLCRVYIFKMSVLLFFYLKME